VAQVGTTAGIFANQTIAADQSGATQNVYVGAQVNQPGQSASAINLYTANNSSLGSWATTVVSAGVSAPATTPAIAIDPQSGKVYVTFTEGSGTALLASSTNFGSSFQTTVLRTYVPSAFAPQPIAIGTFAGTVITALSNKSSSTGAANVEAQTSTDGGVHFGTPTALNPEPLDQWFPVIATQAPSQLAFCYVQQAAPGSNLSNVFVKTNGVQLRASAGSNIFLSSPAAVTLSCPVVTLSAPIPHDVVPGTTVFPVWTGLVGPSSTALFTAGTPPGNVLVAAVLPTSRSVQVGSPATAFVTVINTGTTTATAVGITLITGIPATFAYQTTDPATNALTGTRNTPVDIAAGASQTYVIAITPTAPFGASDIALSFAGTNTVPVQTIIEVNTLLGSASANPVPDIVALAASADPGIVDIPGANGTGVFAVATVNVGASGSITMTADTGGVNLPVRILLCQTNPQTSACLPPGPAASVTTVINAGATPTFGVFVTGTGAVPFDPANNRIFFRAKDAGGVTRGATSEAVRTQ
jgi:hypothetical protein